jgi:hypothetical protein
VLSITVQYPISSHTYGAGAIKRLVMERTFPRLLHLLAHHTDFSTNERDLDDIVNYLTFYLDCIGMADNYALFFHLAQRVKQARDALEPDKSEVLLFRRSVADDSEFIRVERLGAGDDQAAGSGTGLGTRHAPSKREPANRIIHCVALPEGGTGGNSRF